MNKKLSMHIFRSIGNAIVFLCLAIAMLLGGLVFLSTMLSMQQGILAFAADWVGVIAILFSGYLVVLAFAMVMASLAGIVMTIGTLFWIVKNHKEFKKYGDRVEKNYKAQESQRLEEWLTDYATELEGAIMIQESKGRRPKLDTLYLRRNAGRLYQRVFTNTIASLPVTWIVVGGGSSEARRAIIARVELGVKVPHFVVNSTIEVDDLLPRHFKNGVGINLEGDTNDYFTLTTVDVKDSTPLRILPPDVLLKLAQNFDEFDLEFRDTHLDILMNEDRSEEVMNGRIKRIGLFVEELQKELSTRAVETLVATKSNLLEPKYPWIKSLDNAIMKIFQISPKAYLMVAGLLFVILLVQVRRSGSVEGLLADILASLMGAAGMALIITIQWTLSTALAVFAVLTLFASIQNLKYRLRRELYNLKYEFYYKLQGMSDEEVAALKDRAPG